MAEDPNKTQGHATDKTHERIEQAADKIKQKTSNAAHETKEQVDAAADSAEARVHQAVDSGARGAHRAVDKTADWRECGTAAACTLRDRAGSLFEEARDWVREKPVESVALALAAGWLIGRLLSPRR